MTSEVDLHQKLKQVIAKRTSMYHQRGELNIQINQLSVEISRLKEQRDNLTQKIKKTEMKIIRIAKALSSENEPEMMILKKINQE